MTLTPGAWFHGNLYPRRCDVSPDGRLFGYFALKKGKAYFAVSRTPWLEALALWETLGTWTWGCRFSGSGDFEIRACMYEPFQPASYPGGSVSIGPMSTDWPRRDIWNELKRGWEIATENAPGLELRREQPGGTGVRLGLLHRGEGVQLEYYLQDGTDDLTPLPDAVWADWDRQGRLLMATREGKLEVSRCEGTSLVQVWTEDLRGLKPDPQPAPGWASRW